MAGHHVVVACIRAGGDGGTMEKYARADESMPWFVAMVQGFTGNGHQSVDACMIEEFVEGLLILGPGIPLYRRKYCECKTLHCPDLKPDVKSRSWRHNHRGPPRLPYCGPGSRKRKPIDAKGLGRDSVGLVAPGGAWQFLFIEGIPLLWVCSILRPSGLRPQQNHKTSPFFMLCCTD
jgi:hypothetical protein